MSIWPSWNRSSMTLFNLSSVLLLAEMKSSLRDTLILLLALNKPSRDPFWMGNQNDSNIHMLSFATCNYLLLANSLFKYKTAQKITWFCISGRSSEETDHLKVTKRFRSTRQDVRAKRGACIVSDQNMIVAKIHLKFQSSKKHQQVPVLTLRPYATKQYIIIIQSQYQTALMHYLEPVQSKKIRIEQWLPYLNESLIHVCHKRKRKKKP